MWMRAWAISGAAACLLTGVARGAEPASDEGGSLVPPVRLALVDEPRSVYPEIMPGRETEGVNAGGVHFDLDFSWATRYIFRGIDQTTTPGRDENAEQFDGTMRFDLGKLPHPFVGLFVNIFNNDPIARFEEVRPYFGLEWTLKPLIITGGYVSYIHPNRKNLDTQEVFAQLTLDDSRVFRTERPVLSPYIYGAYDLDLYNGFYLEAGLKHDFVFEDWGVTLTPYGDVAYVISNPYFRLVPMGREYGFQHYEVGLIGSISLNHVFGLARRYGEFNIVGALRYSDDIDNRLHADTVLWGGAGLHFRY